MPCVNKDDEYNELSREIHKLMKQFSHYKPESIRINISSSFMARARCKKCGGTPTSYYQIRKPYVFADVSDHQSVSAWMRRWVKSMNDSWYFSEQPRDFHTIDDFSFRLDDNCYLPSWHRTRPAIPDKNNVVEFVSCKCHYTIWAFNQKSTKDRSEIKKRKGKYCYPNKFEY